MKQVLKSIFYSFPVQLVLLHIKKFQVLLVFWFILFAAVNGSFMSTFGVDSLYLAPEYLGEVNALSTSIVGMAVGVFIMGWNITTFILFSRHFRFLATTTRPFLKYCINNFIIPLSFLIFYLIKGIRYGMRQELMTTLDIIVLSIGFLLGFILIIAISFLYFFRADVSIARRMLAVTDAPPKMTYGYKPFIALSSGGSRLIKVAYYLDSPFSTRPVRDVSHYSKEFIENIFNRHHFAAILCVFASFVFLSIIGFFLDNPVFQLPAAASITLFFSILVAVSGAFSYFLQSWSVPFLILLVIVVNILYKLNVIDATNKAYGLNYSKTIQRAVYSHEAIAAMCTNEKMEHDKQSMIEILNKWKAKQHGSKPYMYLICVSGGGARSASFTFNTLQRLDSLSNGNLMKQTFLITGASGGMLGASYFRELYNKKQNGANIHLQDKVYADNISRDLLNPIFSSFVARDLASPAQKFEVGQYSYLKDRGYAFEEKLNENTAGILNKQFKDIKEDEDNARIPLMLFNAVVTNDGRKMIMSTQPVSFLMRPLYDSATIGVLEPDAIDFSALFARQNPMNLRLLTALRMNATFPYVLPNVWLPANPVIDVMDAGFRDNFGVETAARFVNVFQDWIMKNTAGVVLLQIRDRKGGEWDYSADSDNVTEIITKPMLVLQYNWYKMQQYNQDNVLGLTEKVFNDHLRKITFQYIPEHREKAVTLNLHLTKSEKRDLYQALQNPYNTQSFKMFSDLNFNKLRVEN